MTNLNKIWVRIENKDQYHISKLVTINKNKINKIR